MQTSRLRSILFAAVAAASFGTCVAQAQPYQPGPRRVVTHWNHYHLPPPPYGSVWVQEGPQFVLLDGRGFVTRVWVP
jgi:Ni/Co efflux regulator RcnB